MKLLGPAPKPLNKGGGESRGGVAPQPMPWCSVAPIPNSLLQKGGIFSNSEPTRKKFFQNY